MYRNVEEVLQDIYSIKGTRIEPINSTALVCEWCESKGVMGGSWGGLTQAEKHAHAEMIISRIKRVLNRYELAVVECKYGEDLSGIVDITAYIEQQNEGVNLLICDALVLNILKKVPKLMEIQDRFDIARVTLWRKKKQVGGIVAGLLDSAICKLEPEFRQAGIIG